MLRFSLVALLIVMLARAFWQLVDSVIEGATGGSRQRPGTAAATKLARDPVCGTHIVPNPSLSVVHGGATEYFCSDRCLKSYRAR
jgi:YHS domain-containing protein